MSFAVMRSTIVTFLSTSSGVTVIEDQQGAPRPAFPYVSFRFLRPATRVGGIDESTAVTDQHGIAGERTTTVSVNVYGIEAGQIAEEILNSLDLPENIELFSAAGMAHYGESGANDLSALMETKYEKRIQFDLMLRYAFSKESSLSSIESVQLIGETEGSGQPVDIESEININ